MKNINKFLLVLLLAASGSAFAQKEETVANVNGEPVLLSDYNKAKEMITDQYYQVMPDFFNQKDAQAQIEKMAMDKLVDELLIKQKAEAMKIKVFERDIDNGVAEIKKRFSVNKDGSQMSPSESDSVLAQELKKQGMTMSEFRDKVKRDLMARKLVEETVRPKVKTPPEKEVREYFEKINYLVRGDTVSARLSEEEMQEYGNVAAKFKDLVSERIRLRHILIKPAGDDLASKNKALETANAIKKSIDAGADFEDTASAKSQDKESAARGGDIGYVVKGMLPEELEKAAFKLCPGQTAGPIETKFGYHIIRVDEKRIAQKFTFDAAKDDIANLIMQDDFAKEIDKFTKALRSAAKIEIFADKK